MNRLRTFGAFLYDFVIGDDPMVAAVIVIAFNLLADILYAVLDPRIRYD